MSEESGERARAAGVGGRELRLPPRPWLPRSIRTAVPVVAVGLAGLSLLRVAFWRVFTPPLETIDGSALAHAFYLGLKFDLRLLLVVVAPLLLLGASRRLGPFEGNVARALFSLYVAAAASLVLLVHLVDFAHYAYLEARLNASALQYVEDPRVSVRMVWETYPVVRAALGLLLLGLAVFVLVRRLVTRVGARGAMVPRGAGRALVVAACAAAVLGGLWGKVSRYPLRWSEAFFSPSPFVSEVALNPVLMFVDTLGSRARGFDIERTREAYDTIAEFLGVDAPNRARLSFAREARPRGPIRGTPNVVVILLETFASYKVGVTGNPLGTTPRFDALAREGTLFPRFFVPTHGTARSVFTLVTGIPDVDPHEASSRNPLAVRQRTIVTAFDRYEKLYFLGGSATWGNVRGLRPHNIPDLRLFEEGDYEAKPVDVWGISDLALFEEANRELARLGDRPFFAIVQTSGHHRPYTIPDDNRGFRRLEIDDRTAQENGFQEADELNAFRFLDHSLGLFFDAARRERYFANTLFVLLGDHGYPGRAKHLPTSEVELGLVRLRVPLLLYGPSLLPGGRVVETVGSEVDVLPTIAGLCGRRYVNHTLGRDLLDPRFDGARFAFTISDLQGEAKIGLVGPTSYLRTGVTGGATRLVAIDGGAPLEDLASRRPDEARAMERLCRAIYETSRYMLTHNAGSEDARGPDAARPGPEGPLPEGLVSSGANR